MYFDNAKEILLKMQEMMVGKILQRETILYHLRVF